MASRFTSSTQDIPWESVAAEAARVLGSYIRIETTNPPGNEGEAAGLLAELLSADGIRASLHEKEPGRPNLVARLKGDGSLPPVLLLHHMDVVPASASSWSQPPFDGALQDGQIWGRGALDDKGLGTMHLMAFVLLKRLGVPLKRDVILLAVADEEQGGAVGARWMVEEHWPDIECEYVWDEGGSGTRGLIGTRPVFAVAVSEKRALALRLTASGRGGHGSMAAGTSVKRLVDALHVLQQYEPPARYDDAARELFRRVAATLPFPASWLLRHSDLPVIQGLVESRLRKIPSINAMLRDTLTATVVRAGDTETGNAAPDVAEAFLDARLLPDTDPGRFIADLKREVNDDSISIEATIGPEGPAPSPIGSAMFGAFERAIAAHVPGAIVAPFQTPVGTDSRFFRAKGVKAYGLMPAVLTGEDLGTIHGVDERLSVENLKLGVKIALDVLLDLCV